MDEMKIRGNVEVNEGEKDIEVRVELQYENSMKNISLDATRDKIKLNCNSYRFEIVLVKRFIRETEVSAKWLKNKKTLIIKCPFI